MSDKNNPNYIPDFPLATRQVHLDFHTSGLIPGVGSAFDAEAFGRMFREAHVGNVCLFTRCHHGYHYYPTEVGVMHPGLGGFDLLRAQIAALDAVGVEHTLYTTICWDEVSAEAHPEWQARDVRGQVVKIVPDRPATDSADTFLPGWRHLCWNTPYRDFLKAHVAEVCAQFEVPELILDILFPLAEGCYCPVCLASMQARGLNPEDPTQVARHSLATVREFMDEMTAVIRATHPAARIWFNSRLRLDGNPATGSLPELPNMGYLCVESLPSGFWGYNHFPLMARYFQNTPYAALSQTGRFQKTWGDFGGLKNPAALDYECFRMVAFGMACGVGDQLHPTGAMEPATYDLIGGTFAKVQEVEAYAYPSAPLDEIGVVLPTAPATGELFERTLTGALRLLTERQYQFSLIDAAMDFTPYRALVLPDYVEVSEALATKLAAYLAGGGRVLATGRSGRDAEGQWRLPAAPLEALGADPFKPYYLQPEGALLEKVADFRHVMYEGGELFMPRGVGWQILGRKSHPYFNRTWDHFSSHLQTPWGEDTDLPEVAIHESGVAVVGTYLFASYARFANRVGRDVVELLLDRLLGERIFTSNLPSTAEVTVRSHGSDALVHLLHYVPQRRAESIDIVEDVLPVTDIWLSVRLPHAPEAVRAQPGNESLPFTYADGRVEVTLPRLEGYRLLVMPNAL